MKVDVKCEVCGKEESVFPCRAKKYKNLFNKMSWRI